MEITIIQTSNCPDQLKMLLLEDEEKGKSVLLDSIAYALTKDNFAKKSKKFYNEFFEPSIKNLMVLPFHKISDLYIIIKPLSQKLFNGSSG